MRCHRRTNKQGRVLAAPSMLSHNARQEATGGKKGAFVCIFWGQSLMREGVAAASGENWSHGIHSQET